MTIDSRDTYIDTLLSNVAINFRPMGFIAEDVYPIVPVGKQSGFYQTWEQTDWLRQPGMTRRAPNTAARQVDFRIGSAQYIAENFALGGFWTLEEADNAELGAAHTQGRVNHVTGKLMLDYEARVSAQALNTSNVGSFVTPASLWSDLNAGNSDPIGDIKNAITAVRDSTGYQPNKAVIGADVYDCLKFHEDIRGLVFGSVQGGVVTEDMLAGIFDLDKVLVGRTVQDASADDSTTLDGSLVWGGSMVLYYAPAAPSIDDPSWGYSFRYQPPGKPAFQVRRFQYDEETDSQRFDVQYYQDEVITAATLGFQVQSAI